MPIHNADLAAMFEEIAELLELRGENPFRVRAYLNAARQLEGMSRSAAELVAQGEDLTQLPGIGEDLAGRIAEIVATGQCALLQQLREQVPPTLSELLRVPGLGPKRVRALYEDLGVRTADQLVEAVQTGRIHEVKGFGPRLEQSILEALTVRASEPRRFRLAVAAQHAEPLRAALAAVPGVSQVVVAGSFRRCQETVGDLDLLVAATDAGPVMERLVAWTEVRDVVARGATRATVVLGSGLQVDLRVVEEDCFGAALQYFTGSKAHNIELRRLAQAAGFKLSEYGLFRHGERVASKTEESIYKALGLAWIPPELRELRGEFDAARAGKLPVLVTREDLRGELHSHTRFNDGRNTMEELAEAARAMGLTYLAITEHSRRLHLAPGLDPHRLREQMAEIDRLNARLNGITLLKGVEVDILADGKLDLPDELLGGLDLVVGGVHSHFKLPRARQTLRILKAMEHPAFTILAHPTGRAPGERAPFEVDMVKVLRAARKRGCFLELNAHPDRLDLLDVDCRLAREEGVPVLISSDAHSCEELQTLAQGVGTARRGWLERKDVLNTRTLTELRPLLRQTMPRPAGR